ncbi:MAG TPA: S-adenosylmethionine:tRNA ribosyltransferase-isomerase [Roseiarcus sp.]|nr:S-adenosylmethionine:tRNA ribosyltransferase-isomerase [Roseiarcus sp.]
MIAAETPDAAKLLLVEADGAMRRLPRAALAALFGPADLIVANDAATLPASLRGTHEPSGGEIEIRLAGWIDIGDPTRFIAIAFGAGDHRQRTEDRSPPPPLAAGDRLSLGPLVATIETLLDHPRLVALRFLGEARAVLSGLVHYGRPIQYAHAAAPYALWDVWTKIAADPIAFEPPSAGFALDWRMLVAWRSRGVGFATLTHAAGISSTGDAALDQRLPFDEPYRIPERTAVAIRRAKARGGRVVAVGTSVVRALEAAADGAGGIRAGPGVAYGRIGRGTDIRIADAILSGVHQPGESHYELLRAFADDATLDRINAALVGHGYRGHEHGDSVLVERASRAVDVDDETAWARGVRRSLPLKAKSGTSDVN